MAIRSSSLLNDVLDPRGQPTSIVQPKPLAPRLETLEGKTIQLIDVGFGGGWEFLEEAAAWLERTIPNVQDRSQAQDRHHVRRRAADVGGREGQRPRRHLRGGWLRRLCGQCGRSLQGVGIEVRNTHRAHLEREIRGVPRARTPRTTAWTCVSAIAPYPLVGRPRDVLRRYVEGDDPYTGRPLMPQIVDALTKPLSDEEKNPKAERGAPRPRLLKPDNEEGFHRLFLENGWTDGMPIVLPTEERVAHMLTGTSAKPDEVVGRMTVTIHQERLEYTVEKVAINAVMAGAGPEHLPVILAVAVHADSRRCPSSTTSFATMAVVNGPIREEIGMNSGLGALSPFNHANAVIGRAWTLMSINLADARPGETFMGSMGNNLNYNNMMHRRERGAQRLGAVPRTQGLQEGREHRERLPGLERDQQHGRRRLLPSRPRGDAHHHAGLPLPEGGDHPGDGPARGRAPQGAGLRRSGQAVRVSCRRTSR